MIDWLRQPLVMRSAGDGSGGDSSDGERENEWRERRIRELEGTAVEVLKSRVLDVEADLYKRRRELKAALARLGELEPQLAELEQYRGYGKPEELAARLEQAGKNESELIALKRERAVREAARLTQLELEIGGKREARPINADKLAELVALKGLEVEIGEGIVSKDGKPVQGKIAQVKKADGKLVPLADYLRSDLAAFADWLADTSAPARGTPVVPQPAGGGTPTSANPAQRYLERAYVRPDERGKAKET